MKLSCNQIALNSAIQTVYKVADKNLVQAMTGILFDATKDHLRLVSSDGKITIETLVPADIQEKGIALVPARMIKDIINKIPSDIINIELDPKDNLLITSGLLKFKILSYNANDFQDSSMEDIESELTMETKVLDKIINQVKFAISNDNSRPALMGALFEFEKDKLTIVSVDGFRMAIKKEKIESDISRNVIIPETALNELKKIISSSESTEETKITISKNKICFTLGSTKMISNLIAGEFINYQKILPASNSSSLKIDSKIFKGAIERSKPLQTDVKSKTVRLSLTDDFVEFSSESENGEYKETIAIKLEGEDLVIGFNPQFLTEGIDSISAEEIEIKFTNAMGPCVITPTTGEDDYLYLILPCRLVK